MKTFNASIDLTASVFRINSYFVSETAGAAAIVNFRNGSVTGPIYQQVRIAAVTGGTNSNRDFARSPLQFPSGLYIEVNAGTVVGGVQSV